MAGHRRRSAPRSARRSACEWITNASAKPEERLSHRPHPGPGDWDPLLCSVEDLMELDDDRRSLESSKQRHGEVCVQHGTRPPLEDDDVRPPRAEATQITDQIQPPEPVDASHHGDGRVKFEPRGSGTHSRPARVQEGWNELAHRDDGDGEALCESVRKSDRVVGHRAEKAGAGADNEYPREPAPLEGAKLDPPGLVRAPLLPNRFKTKLPQGAP